MLGLILGLLLLAPAAFPSELEEPIATVERLRGLKFERSVVQKTIERKDLRKFLVAQLEKELPVPVDDYLRVLDALELIENKPDTLGNFLGLYDAQVLAFYDAMGHVYVSLSEPPDGIELNEMMTSAVAVHELTHALQDQRFNAGERILAMRGNTDAQMAYQAVLEGEALLVMAGALFEQLGQSIEMLVNNELLLSSLATMAELDPGIPASAPRYFVESMKFPYLQGFRLVVEAYRRGGWAAVDALHRNPPKSTEQVLHPELYFGRRDAAVPASVAMPSRDALLEDAMGEFGWRFLLGEQPAAGWGGDKVQIVPGSNTLKVFIETSWDTEADARQFASAYEQFLQSRSIQAQVVRRARRVSIRY